jgi:hypothetical protein
VMTALTRSSDAMHRVRDRLTCGARPEVLDEGDAAITHVGALRGCKTCDPDWKSAEIQTNGIAASLRSITNRSMTLNSTRDGVKCPPARPYSRNDGPRGPLRTPGSSRARWYRPSARRKLLDFT